MPNRNRGRRNAGRGERGMPMGRSQTPVRARPVEDPVLVVAEAITESQVVSNLHDTSQEHRNTIKQLKERIQELTKQIKQKNRELSSYKGLEQKVASLQNKIERMETPKIQKIKPTQKDIVDFCQEKCSAGQKMADIFGVEVMKGLFKNAEELIFEGTGLNDRASLLLFWKTLKDSGLVKTFEKKDQTHHIINLTKHEEVERLEEIEAQFKRFILDLCSVVPAETHVMKDGNIISSGLVEYIKGLQEDNKKLRQQIEEDDILFDDCQ